MRWERANKRRRKDIIAIAIRAVIYGADGWGAIERFDTFLEIPNGIPSRDACGRVFSNH